MDTDSETKGREGHLRLAKMALILHTASGQAWAAPTSCINTLPTLAINVEALKALLVPAER